MQGEGKTYYVFAEKLVCGWVVLTSEGWGLYLLYWHSVEHSLFHVGYSNRINVLRVTDVGLSVGGTVVRWTFGRGKSLNVRRMSNVQHDSNFTDLSFADQSVSKT